jgi:hypothetical protein
MTWGHWAGHIVLLVSTLIALAVIISFKVWHKARRRRAPLAGRDSVGHLPGHALLDRIRHHEDGLGRAVFTCIFAMPLMFMVWASYRVPWDEVEWDVAAWMFLFGASALFAWGMFDYVRHYKQRERAQDGWTAEQVTGQQLNRLIAQGCHVLHDLPAEAGNIDHIVIGPRGVYAVETKSFRKPKGVTEDPKHPGHQVRYDSACLRFPDFTTRAPLEQAARQARWLERTLRNALGRAVPVIPALALPGWYIVKSDEGKKADVQVFTPMGRGAEFMAWQPDTLDDAHRREVARILAARYPSIDG